MASAIPIENFDSASGAERTLANQSAAQISARWTLEKLACFAIVAAIVFLMGADFRGDTGEKFSVHWQIYLRLLVAFVAGIVGALMLFPRTYRDFLTWPGLLLSAYIGWYALTLPFSIDRNYSIAAWVSLVGVGVFIPGAMRLLGGYRFMLGIAAGLVMYLAGSWFVYLFVPEIGVFQEQVTQTEVFERMGGLGHPNELGFYSAFTVVMFFSLLITRRLGIILAGAGILLGVVTLVGCFSRTATLVCCIGLLFTLQNHWRLRGNAFAGVLVLSLIVLAAFVSVGSGQLDWAIDDALRGLTKTGNTRELATATGRTEIWQYGISQIAESPLYGYGYCSARFVMEEHSYHCHNIVLNAMMFGGILSGLIVVAMILYHWYAVFFRPLPEVDGLIVIMLTGGMVEGLLGAPSPSASTLIWISLLLWRQLDMQVAAPSVETQQPEFAFDR